MPKKRAHYRMVEDDDPHFARFWNAYPKRVAKKDARKAWADLDPNPATVDRMLIALAWQCQQPAWTKDDGQYVPYPASWLRAERWDDEAPKLARQTQAGAAAMTVLETLLGGDRG